MSLDTVQERVRRRFAMVRRLRHASAEVSERVHELSTRVRSRREAHGAVTLRSEDFTLVEEELRATIDELEEQNAELLHATQELEAEHARYRDLFDNAPDAYVVTTLHGTIREANHAAGALLNVPPPFLRDKMLTYFVARQDVRAFREALRALERAPQKVVVDVRVRPRRGPGLVAVSLTAAPFHTRASTQVRWLARASRAAPLVLDAERAREQAMAILAGIGALRSPDLDPAAREDAISRIARIALEQLASVGASAGGAVDGVAPIRFEDLARGDAGVPDPSADPDDA